MKKQKKNLESLKEKSFNTLEPKKAFKVLGGTATSLADCTKHDDHWHYDC